MANFCCVNCMQETTPDKSDVTKEVSLACSKFENKHMHRKKTNSDP